MKKILTKIKEVEENATELAKAWAMEIDLHSARVGRKKYLY